MPHRDPTTGQFVSGDGMEFDDIEVASFGFNGGVEAANNSGITSFRGEDNQVEGIPLIDYDDLVDRNEDLMLLSASHRLTVYGPSTSTADGTVHVACEISSSPSVSGPTIRAGRGLTNSFDGGEVVGGVGFDDTIDIIGRPLAATGHSAFSDGGSGVGGSGSAGEDNYEVSDSPGEYGMFHPRDEVFLNAQLSTHNVSDAATHFAVAGQHVYGVMED